MTWFDEYEQIFQEAGLLGVLDLDFPVISLYGPHIFEVADNDLLVRLMNV